MIEIVFILGVLLFNAVIAGILIAACLEGRDNNL